MVRSFLCEGWLTWRTCSTWLASQTRRRCRITILRIPEPQDAALTKPLKPIGIITCAAPPYIDSSKIAPNGRLPSCRTTADTRYRASESVLHLRLYTSSSILSSDRVSYTGYWLVAFYRGDRALPTNSRHPRSRSGIRVPRPVQTLVRECSRLVWPRQNRYRIIPLLVFTFSVHRTRVRYRYRYGGLDHVRHVSWRSRQALAR